MKRLIIICTVLSLNGCESSLDTVDPCVVSYDILQHLAVRSIVYPAPLVVGSRIEVRGESFISGSSCAVAEVLFSGYMNGEAVEVVSEPEIISTNELVVMVPESLIPTGSDEAVFDGAVVVRYLLIDSGQTMSAYHELSVGVTREISPHLKSVEHLEAHLNDRLIVTGEEFLDGRSEGSTHIIVDGWFEVDGGDLLEVDEVLVAAELVESSDRTRATFLWSPTIGGIQTGTFRGTLRPLNTHRDGTMSTGASIEVEIVQRETALLRISPGEVSLGQLVEATGRGFIGSPEGDSRGDQGITSVRLIGEFTPCNGPRPNDCGVPYPVDTELVGRWRSGSRIIYDVTASNASGYLHAVDLNANRGVFVGSAVPVLTYGAQRIEGIGLEQITFNLGPVRQIVWVRFIRGFSESLELFGLGAVEGEIRDRVLARMEEIYCPTDAPDRCINVEFRTEEPQDFALGAYAIVDIGGADPNNMGLLGYDNTPGKDVHNLRLWDHVGGENALGGLDGVGYGGVFVDSMFSWSEHPPFEPPRYGPSPDPLFDDVFDPLRYDEVVAGEWPDGADEDRLATIERAIHAISSVVADTAAHEFGHTLGVAQPMVEVGGYHNPEPRDGCLMDSGSNRPFEERARLSGNPGATFCSENLDYLLHTLPAE